MLRRAFIAFAAWQAWLNDRLATLGKNTRVENSTQSSKAALLLVVCRCQQLLRRALKAEDKLQARRNHLSRQAASLPSDSFS